MSAVDEELRVIILRALPTISMDIQQALTNKIKSCGLEFMEDMKYVTKEDIVDILPAIQLRRLLKAFEKGIAEANVHESVLHYSLNS